MGCNLSVAFTATWRSYTVAVVIHCTNDSTLMCVRVLLCMYVCLCVCVFCVGSLVCVFQTRKGARKGKSSLSRSERTEAVAEGEFSINAEAVDDTDNAGPYLS